MGSGLDEKRPTGAERICGAQPRLLAGTAAAGLAYTAAGFKKFGIFKSELEEYGRLTIFKERVDFYTALAVKELQGTPLSETDYENLRNWRLSHPGQALCRRGGAGGKRQAGRPDCGYSYRRARQGQILYEATGEPYFMLALVGNEGQSRLTVGVAFQPL